MKNKKRKFVDDSLPVQASPITDSAESLSSDLVDTVSVNYPFLVNFENYLVKTEIKLIQNYINEIARAQHQLIQRNESKNVSGLTTHFDSLSQYKNKLDEISLVKRKVFEEKQFFEQKLFALPAFTARGAALSTFALHTLEILISHKFTYLLDLIQRCDNNILVQKDFIKHIHDLFAHYQQTFCADSFHTLSICNTILLYLTDNIYILKNLLTAEHKFQYNLYKYQRLELSKARNLYSSNQFVEIWKNSTQRFFKVLMLQSKIEDIQLGTGFVI